jgi:hypothetical protein
VYSRVVAISNMHRDCFALSGLAMTHAIKTKPPFLAALFLYYLLTPNQQVEREGILS